MTEEEQEKRDIALLDGAVANLMEHFDAIQIFATRFVGGQTESCQRGGGNWYARKALTRDWVLRSDQQEICEIIRQEENDDA